MPRLILSLVVAAGLTLGAVGCSSDEGGSAASTTVLATIPPPTHPATEAGLIGAGTAYFEAGNKGDIPTQYAVMSKRCLEKWPSITTWQGNVASATRILENLGFEAEGATVESVAVSGFTPTASTVNAVIKTKDGKTIDILGTTSWVYEDGGSRVDSCDAASI